MTESCYNNLSADFTVVGREKELLDVWSVYIDELKSVIETKYEKMMPRPVLNKLQWIDAFLKMDQIIPDRNNDKE